MNAGANHTGLDACIFRIHHLYFDKCSAESLDCTVVSNDMLSLYLKNFGGLWVVISSLQLMMAVARRKGAIGLLVLGMVLFADGGRCFGQVTVTAAQEEMKIAGGKQTSMAYAQDRQPNLPPAHEHGSKLVAAAFVADFPRVDTDQSEHFFLISGLILVIVLLVILTVIAYRQKNIITTTSKELQKAEARYRLLFKQSPISLWEEDLSAVKSYLDDLAAEGVTDFGLYFDRHPRALRTCAENIRVTDVNDRTLELYEVKHKQDLSSIWEILPQGSEWIIRDEILAFLKHGSFEITIENRTISGRDLTLELRAVIAEGYEETWEKVYASVVDITEQTQLKQEKKAYEKQMQQSQKLEAIGSLAGGIAHDFNNILSPIMGRAELMLMEAGDNSALREHCQTILDASKRARDLIKQILTFSREVDQEIKPVSLRKVVEEVIHLVRPTLPTTITLQKHFKAKLPYVMADVTQLHQVVINLVTNAFHAMENTGGTLSLSLREQTIGVNNTGDGTLTPGRYLTLDVADTGHGIDATTISKIFDPYFTTKARHKGTGLGLSVVHGILRGYGGGIRVLSEVGVGTTFQVLLPIIEFADGEEVRQQRTGPLPRGNEHILLVDDEKSVAEVTKSMLEKLGYQVTVRVSSLEALEAFRNLNRQFDMVVTDLTMPRMTGLELFGEIRQLRADIPVIVTTGFSEQLDSAKSTAVGVDGYLNKPVLIEDLAYTVRLALDRHEQGASAE